MFHGASGAFQCLEEGRPRVCLFQACVNRSIVGLGYSIAITVKPLFRVGVGSGGRVLEEIGLLFLFCKTVNDLYSKTLRTTLGVLCSGHFLLEQKQVLPLASVDCIKVVMK